MSDFRPLWRGEGGVNAYPGGLGHFFVQIGFLVFGVRGTFQKKTSLINDKNPNISYVLISFRPFVNSNVLYL